MIEFEMGLTWQKMVSSCGKMTRIGTGLTATGREMNRIGATMIRAGGDMRRTRGEPRRACRVSGRDLLRDEIKGRQNDERLARLSLNSLGKASPLPAYE